MQEQIQAAKDKFIADARLVDHATRRLLIAKLSRYTRLGGERLHDAWENPSASGDHPRGHRGY